MFIEAVKTSDIAPGGMLGLKLNGFDIVICNYEGNFYALDRRCGHASVYLERGALAGYILTCPLHCAQFDITTGEALSGPVPEAPACRHADPSDPALATHDLKTYPVKVEAGGVKVDLPSVP